MKHQIKNLFQYVNDYEKSIVDMEGFWGNIANDFKWIRKWDKTLEWNFKEPKIGWFLGGRLNITENIFERLIPTHGNKTAIIWEPNDSKSTSKRISYNDLFKETCKFANAMRSIGIKKGDRVIIYMPMVPESVVAMLACARIGAIHSVVFAGFSSMALADRINDCQAKMVITSDGNFRGEKTIQLKSVVDKAISKSSLVEKVVVLKRTGQDININSDVDIWWNDFIDGQSNINKAEEMDSEDSLFILYTSGSTGKPKGVVHSTAGYMIYTYYSF